MCRQLAYNGTLYNGTLYNRTELEIMSLPKSLLQFVPTNLILLEAMHTSCFLVRKQNLEFKLEITLMYILCYKSATRLSTKFRGADLKNHVAEAETVSFCGAFPFKNGQKQMFSILQKPQ